MSQLDKLNKIHNFINEELIPKYDCLEKCTMHILPKELGLKAEVEFIITAKKDIDEYDFSVVNFLLERNIKQFGYKLLDSQSYDSYFYILIRH